MTDLFACVTQSSFSVRGNYAPQYQLLPLLLRLVLGSLLVTSSYRQAADSQ